MTGYKSIEFLNSSSFKQDYFFSLHCLLNCDLTFFSTPQMHCENDLLVFENFVIKDFDFVDFDLKDFDSKNFDSKNFESKNFDSKEFDSKYYDSKNFDS